MSQHSLKNVAMPKIGTAHNGPYTFINDCPDYLGIFQKYKYLFSQNRDTPWIHVAISITLSHYMAPHNYHFDIIFTYKVSFDSLIEVYASSDVSGLINVSCVGPYRWVVYKIHCETTCTRRRPQNLIAIFFR